MHDAGAGLAAMRMDDSGESRFLISRKTQALCMDSLKENGDSESWMAPPWVCLDL